jgi:MraZ protein
MFTGEFVHNIDDKGRLIIPARFRDLLSGGAFVTQGFDNNLVVYTAEVFHRINEQINTMNLTDTATRLLRRKIFSNAYPIDFDKLGRMVLPQQIRQNYQLENSAVIIGTGEYFEIWSPELWKLQCDILQNSEANEQRYQALNLSLA